LPHVLPTDNSYHISCQQINLNTCIFRRLFLPHVLSANNSCHTCFLGKWYLPYALSKSNYYHFCQQTLYLFSIQGFQETKKKTLTRKHYVIITIWIDRNNSGDQPGSHGPNRSINLLDVKFAALRTDNLVSTHRWRFITS